MENNNTDEEQPPPQFGDSAPQQTTPLLQRGNTNIQVDELLNARNRTLRAGMCQGSLSVIILVLDIVGVVNRADDKNCDSEPLEWGTYFLVHAVLIVVLGSINLVVLYATTLTVNKAMIRGSIHMMKGAASEAAKELTEGMRLQQKGKSLILKVACLACLVMIFAIAWFIVGIVTYFNNDSEPCSDARSWFIGIFIVSLSMQGLTSVMKPKQKQGEGGPIMMTPGMTIGAAQ